MFVNYCAKFNFSTAEESLLGTFGNQWELFATHDCAEIPLAAIGKKFLQPLCLRGEPKKEQYFCRYE
jgi:hypothetical protein